MTISRNLAIKILKYLDNHKYFYFPFLVMCKEYSDEDDDFVEVGTDEWENIEADEKYQTFELWENLQDLRDETDELLAKGFIERITGDSLESHLAELVKNYKESYKENLDENNSIENYGDNEFLKGKAEAYKECLELVKKYRV
jgi:hypothetical protein